MGSPENSDDQGRNVENHRDHDEPGRGGTAGQQPRHTVDQLFRKLEESTRRQGAARNPGLEEASSRASEHVGALRQTMSAQQEAQELLAAASRARNAASEQAERIVREAQEAADQLQAEARDHAHRAQQETANWAAEQRRAIDDVIRDLSDAARRDAEEIRSDALNTAMAEAEGTAREYATRATAAAERDADAIRGQARGVMDESSSLLALASMTLHEMTGTLGGFLDSVREQAQAMQSLLDRVEHAMSESPTASDRPSPASRPEDAGDPTPHHDEPRRPLGTLFRGPDVH